MKGNIDNWYADLGNGEYRNPILYTDYSDPDAIRVGDDYFMTASSFCNTPGLPILHSKDLVNWKVINYALRNIPFERYEKSMHGCGVWAPAIRYHEGEYIIFFPMPDEGIFVTKTKDPWGEWSEPHAIFEGKGWIDPCPFWDDDGRAYMVSAFAKSRIGFKSILHLTEMTPDCMSLKDEGVHIFDGEANGQITIEGPKMYKRNGYYYIMAPAGGVKPGWEVVLRSKNVWGPYEHMIVLAQGDTVVNGPHQGAWLDTQTGEDYFLHFQDVYAAGRIVHLQPVTWINDWPVMGEQISDTCGQPVLRHKMPDIGSEGRAAADEYRKANNLPAIYAPDASDDFSGDRLGLQWQFNANHKDDWYSFTGDSIRLKAITKTPDTSIANFPGLMLQKWIAPEFCADTVLYLHGIENGNLTGMVSMGVIYGALAVKKEMGSCRLVAVSGKQTFSNEMAYSTDNVDDVCVLPMDVEKIYLRNRIVAVHDGTDVPKEKIHFDYSFDGISYVNALTIDSEAGRWVGVKNGLFACDESGNESGFGEFGYFDITVGTPDEI